MAKSKPVEPETKSDPYAAFTAPQVAPMSAEEVGKLMGARAEHNKAVIDHVQADEAKRHLPPVAPVQVPSEPAPYIPPVLKANADPDMVACFELLKRIHMGNLIMPSAYSAHIAVYEMVQRLEKRLYEQPKPAPVA